MAMKDPVLLLAGAAPGLGAAIAARFARAGWRVAGLSRSGGLERELGGAYRHVVGDVTDPGSVAEAVARIERDVGSPSALVYDPTRLVVKPFTDLSPAEFEAVWRVTCLGAMIVTQALVPRFLAAGRGTIVFTGATASVKGGPRFASLASAKFALRGLAQSLAREFGPRGIHVVHAVLDGLVWCPQTEVRFPGVDREACLEPDAIAAAYLDLVGQHACAWTHEIDLRPYRETF
jgi:NAD(P)-dependent dehydrogenase (short-subunit alcohol dehydrogenase family)